jgi:hypothetical protein
VLYQIIRAIKPRNIIEIGAGNSSKVMVEALRFNDQEDHKCSLSLIEPFEQPWLETLYNVNVIREKVEDISLNFFKALESGDLLFIDSSHIIRPGGDVLYIYQYIIPILNKGVYVHVHDIFSPRDYLRRWLTEDVRFWNEQYLLEVLLTNPKYKVVLALNFLKHRDYGALKSVSPFLTLDREPGSFYFQIDG